MVNNNILGGSFYNNRGVCLRLHLVGIILIFKITNVINNQEDKFYSNYFSKLAEDSNFNNFTKSIYYQIETDKVNFTRKLISTNPLNNTIASNGIDNPNEMKLISKTPIKYNQEEKINIQCKNNLILRLLPLDILENTIENLNEFPTQSEIEKCKFTDNGPYLSCCNEKTINLFYDYIKKIIIPIKTNIFANNLFYLSLIYNEHYRNFIDGFGLNKDIFNDLFQEYANFKDKIYNLTEILVKESLKHTWNSFCNYVCRPDYFNLYNSYNYTYSQNNTLSYNLFIEFFDNETKISNFSGLVTEFVKLQKSFNFEIQDIYANIISKSQSFNYTKSNNQTLSLVKKSLEDGRNFFFQLNKELQCGNNLNLTKFNCEELIRKENICKPFLCLDNIFTQFIDSSKEPIEYELDNYNYTNSVYLNSSQVNLMSFDDEITDLINSQIYFSSASHAVISIRLILGLIVVIIFI